MIRRYLLAYLGAGLAFAGLDAIWLTLANAAIYKPALHSVLIDGFRPVPAVLFYLVYLLGVMVFAVSPALTAGRWIDATRKGALFGFFAYATYDLTNQATLARWSWVLTGCDLVWGSAASGLAGMAALSLARRLKLVEGARP